MEFLEGHLSFAKRRALEEEGAQCQMAGTLMSLTLIEHYLVSFAGITRASTLELAEVKE